MIDIGLLRNKPEELKKALSDRIASDQLKKAMSADKAWRKAKNTLDSLLAKRNELSIKAQKDTSARAEVKSIKKDIEHAKLTELEARKTFEHLFSAIPNIPSQGTPKGENEKYNVTIRTCGNPRNFPFTPKEYIQLNDETFSEGLQQAAEASGARFVYMKKNVAKLEWALIQYALSKITSKGFELLFPPTIIKKETMQAMGYLDQAGDQEIFHLQNPMETNTSHVLVGTAEQSLGGLFIHKEFLEKELPIRYVAFTPCYRREAGSYGKDTKGIFRLHQFEKIEMFSVTTPAESEKEHSFILSIQEEMMNDLDIPYRVVDLAAGDLGLPSSRTFDIESFLPGQLKGEGQYRETHSTSNCTDFQARRLNTKVILNNNERVFAHTVNGTGFAMQRIIIAILENYQMEDGSFQIPEALKKYWIQ